MTDPVHTLRKLPRDTAIIVDSSVADASLSEKLWHTGMHVVHVGTKANGTPCATDMKDLQKRWSLLTRRVPNVAVVTRSDEMRALVNQMAQQAEVNRETTYHRAQGWVTGLLRNMRHLRGPTAMQVTGLRGVPAFIVGAGSSLDRNYKLISECKKKGIVIAVNGANRACNAHVALTIESNDLRYKLGDLGKDTLRAFGMTADPRVMAHGEGPLLPIYSGELATIPESITGVPRLLSSATGGAAALSLVERWGCDPIVLIGQDFEVKHGGLIYPECIGLGESRSYIDKGQWRFDWDSDLKKRPRHNPLNEADTVHAWHTATGETCLTSTMLGNQMLWFSQVAIRLEEIGDKRLLINASESGCAIDGWKHGALADVLSELPNRLLTVGYPAAGVPVAALRQWFWNGMGVCERVSRLTHALPDLLRSDLARFPLLELWCYPYVQEIMADRRESAPSRWYADEYMLARKTLRELGDAVRRGAEELLGMLEKELETLW